jgi:L-amino acid N-acyltransferase YncA
MKPAAICSEKPTTSPTRQAHSELEKMFAILESSGRHKSFTSSEYESLIAAWATVGLCLRGPGYQQFIDSSYELLRPARSKDATHELLAQLFRLSIVLGRNNIVQLHAFSAAQSAFIEFIQPYQSQLDKVYENKAMARWKYQSGA